MDLNTYQVKAQRTSNKELSREQHLLNGLLGLSGEVGECCDIVKKSLYQDHRNFENKLLDELGDVMWYVAETAAAIGFTLNDVAMFNIKKLERRYPDGFDSDKSLHREEDIGG